MFDRSQPRHGNLKQWLLALGMALSLTAGARGQETITVLNLNECIALGMTRQPALAAAQASLSAAQSGQQSINNMRFAALFSRDVPVRKQQACWGVTIASAQLLQVEWETRYAITRNYYSVIYARKQELLVKDLIKRLTESRDIAQKLTKAGGTKVNQLDVDLLTLNINLIKNKDFAASVGSQKAMAALREAIGIGYGDPLNIIDDTLPAPVAALNKDELVAQALANRGELVKATGASYVHSLEITAQGRMLFKRVVPTFASGGDIHAMPIPAGFSNGIYRPGAVGPEMPVQLVGRPNDRTQRARDFYDRSMAVVDKTQQLISLEVEDMYLKWFEAIQNMRNLEEAKKQADELFETIQRRFNEGNVAGDELLRTRAQVDQTQALYNEALYDHALALAGLERTTAGGYRIPVADKK